MCGNIYPVLIRVENDHVPSSVAKRLEETVGIVRATVFDDQGIIIADPSYNNLETWTQQFGVKSITHKGDPRFIERLNELVSMNIGWDGFNGKPTTFTAARRMQVAINQLGPYIERHSINIVPSTHGFGQLEWHTIKGSVEIEFSAAWAYEVNDLTGKLASMQQKLYFTDTINLCNTDDNSDNEYYAEKKIFYGDVEGLYDSESLKHIEWCFDKIT